MLKIFAKSFNYRGCYEHVFSSLGIQRYPSRLPELMNGAQALANQINTFVLNDADGTQAIQLGANHVWKLSGKPDERMIEDYAGVMADTIRQHGADGLVLLPNTRRGKLLAAKLGYRL